MAEKGSAKRFSGTKGKGSGKGAGASSTVTSKNNNNNSSSPEHTSNDSSGMLSTPHIPLIKCSSNAEKLPKYHAALQRSQTELLPAEDLDAIQLELEMLLSTVALRYRVLKSEIETIDSRKLKILDKPPISPGKRRRTDEPTQQQQQQQQQQPQQQQQQPPHVGKNFKLREKPGKLSTSTVKLSKQKNSSASPAPSQNTDDSSDVPSSKDHPPKQNYPRNDTPNKFWLSVEPYSMPITQEDLRLLDDLIDEYSGPLLPPIPDLGAHYAAQWGIEDIKEEQDTSNPIIKGKGRSATTNGQQNGGMMRVLRNSKKLMGEGITGPLTQRLVSALMEENLISDSATTTTTTTSTENSNSSLENIPNNHTNMIQTRSAVNLLRNGISIERRVRKELIEQGILDAKDIDPPSVVKQEDEDEVLSEIKRVRSELVAIADFNTSELHKLQGAAKEEMKRLEIKRKLDDVDQEVIEQHKRILLAKQKGRQLTKQEREDILRLTEKQKKLSTELDEVQIPGYNLNFL
ncbi:unnamed protein product [Diamesa serratosioi]